MTYTADMTRCVRFSAEGQYLGWCGVLHRYEDPARTHVRVLNRSWSNEANPEPWKLRTEAKLAEIRARRGGRREGSPRLV